MRPFILFEKNRCLRIASWVPVVSLAFAGAPARSQDPSPPDAVARAATPPIEEPRGPATPAQPDVPSSVAGEATPAAVSGGVVVVRALPSSSPSGALRVAPRRRAQLPAEFLQQEPSAAAPPSAARASSEPQYPQQRGVPRAGSSAATELESGPAAPGDSVQQWTGLSNTGALSPDTTHAVGPGHVVEAVNSAFSIYTKFGTPLQGPIGFESFLNLPAGWAGFTFDPRLIYDHFHQKFVLLVLGKDEPNLKSYYWVAVSQGSDPTGAWWISRFEVTATVNGVLSWLDHAGLTADNWGVYVTGNYFGFTGAFRGSSLWSINPDILSGGATNGWRFLDLRWTITQQAFALQPAQPHSVNADATTFFVNTFNGVGSQVLLWKLSGDRTNAPSLTNVAISTANYEAIGNEVDQPGSAVDIYGGDARVASAVYSQGRVFYVLTDDVNNNGNSAGWLTVRLNVATNTNEWQDLLWGGPGVYYFYPALTILGGDSADANLAVFGNWTDTSSSPGQFASGLYKIYDAQPATTGPLVSFTSGVAAYVALDGSGRNRFGSHSGAGYDWSCGHAWARWRQPTPPTPGGPSSPLASWERSRCVPRSKSARPTAARSGTRGPPGPSPGIPKAWAPPAGSTSSSIPARATSRSAAPWPARRRASTGRSPGRPPGRPGSSWAAGRGPASRPAIGATPPSPSLPPTCA